MRRIRRVQGMLGLAIAAAVVPPLISVVSSSSELSLGKPGERGSAAALDADAKAWRMSSDGIGWQNEFAELITPYSMDPEWRYAYSEIIGPGEAVLAFGGAAPDGLDEELSALGGRVTVIERTGFTELEIQGAGSRAAQAIVDLGATSVLAVPDTRDRTITVSFSGLALDAAESRRVQSTIENEVLRGGLAAAGFSVNLEESETAVFVADALAIAD